MNWEGVLYVIITLKWDNKIGIFGLSMPGYVNTGQNILHTTPDWPKYAPHPRINTEDVTKNQLTDPTDMLDLMKDTKLARLQKSFRTLLYYEMSVDTIVLMEKDAPAIRQKNRTGDTPKESNKLLELLHHSPGFSNKILLMDWHATVYIQWHILPIRTKEENQGGRIFVFKAKTEKYGKSTK